MIGVVRRWDAKRGFGFVRAVSITAAGDLNRHTEDDFVLKAHIAESVDVRLRPGELVEYDRVHGERGAMAVNVRTFRRTVRAWPDHERFSLGDI